MADFTPNIPANRPMDYKRGHRLKAADLTNIVGGINRLTGGVKPPSQNFRQGNSTTFDSADCAADSNVSTLSGTGSTIDGHTVAAGDVVFLTAQTSADDNGLWLVPTSGAWNQQTPTFQPELVGVLDGSTYADTLWLLDAVDTYSQATSQASGGGAVVVAVASTANIASLSGTGSTVDGYTLGASDLILLKNQSTATQNGVYTVNSGSWTPASPQQPPFVIVVNGTLSADGSFFLSATNVYSKLGAFYS